MMLSVYITVACCQWCSLQILRPRHVVPFRTWFAKYIALTSLSAIIVALGGVLARYDNKNKEQARAACFFFFFAYYSHNYEGEFLEHPFTGVYWASHI